MLRRQLARRGGSSRAGSAQTVIALALGFPPGDDTLPLQPTELRSDHGEAVFGFVVVAKQHDPIARLPELVRMRRVREQRGVMALMARRVQDREPGFARRIESARCDFLQHTRGGFLTVFAIDIEHFGNGRLARAPRRRCLSADAPEALRE